MSTMTEMALEYRMAAVKIKLKIKQLKKEDASLEEVNQYKYILAQIRDIVRLLDGYYDVPRYSEDAAVGWKAGKNNDR